MAASPSRIFPDVVARPDEAEFAPMNGLSLLSPPTPIVTLFPHTYHPDGRPKTTEDAAGLHTYLYQGPNGALSGETISGGLLAGAVITYGHDTQKRRDQVTWTWGSGQSRTTGLTFDAAGRLHTVTWPGWPGSGDSDCEIPVFRT